MSTFTRLREAWCEFAYPSNAKSSSARDFLARERNFGSWLRLSATLFVLAGALIIRFRLADISARSSPRPGTAVRGSSEGYAYDDSHGYRGTNEVGGGDGNGESAQAVFIASPSSPPPSDANVSSSPYSSSSVPSCTYPLTCAICPCAPSTLLVPTILETTMGSLILGSMFFGFAVGALLIGIVDYMGCQRGLEDAERTGRAFVQSGRIVQACQVLIALAISATAVLLLVTEGVAK